MFKGEKEIIKSKKDFVEEFFSFVKDLIIIFLIVFFIRTFILMPFQISGGSMNNSYYDKEFILVDRFSYLDIPFLKTGNPKRGDVIVFKPQVDKDKEYFIKRIIGIPGDTIKIENGKVYILEEESQSFKNLDEGYLNEDNTDATFVGSVKPEIHIYKIPEDSYFVMGDNRINSRDSRACFINCSVLGTSNYIKKEYVIGKVWLDLGYYDWLRFSPRIEIGTFKFFHPRLGIETKPKWFSSPSKWDYGI